MAKQDRTPKSIKKFLFDQHNFDEQHEEQQEEPDLPPPPPVFSEEELASARREGFEEGQAKAFAEAQASREKEVATLLETINRNIGTLFDAEEKRARLYEAEVIHLAHVIFDRIFPVLKENRGLEDIKALIEKVISRQKDSLTINIEVHEALVPDIKKLISQREPENNRIAVKEAKDLGPGDCRIGWENGGAVRQPGVIAETIEKELAQLLADRPRLSDNSDIIPPSGEER